MDEKLVTENIKLIYLVINRMHLTAKTEDEYQAYYDAGLEGLIKGAKKYDESSGYKPSSFLYACIANEIKHHLVLKTMPKRLNPNGSDISLHSTIGENDEACLEKLIPDPNVNIEAELEKKLEIERLMYAVNQLENETDKQVLKMYYGLEGYKPGTYESIAKELGVSKNMIGIRVKRCYPKLKKILENSKEVFMLESNNNIYTETKVSYVEPKEQKSENTLTSLNDMLFAQLKELNDENRDFDKTIRKSYVVAQLAQQITNNANTMLKAAKMVSEDKANKNTLKMIGIDNV